MVDMVYIEQHISDMITGEVHYSPKALPELLLYQYLGSLIGILASFS